MGIIFGLYNKNARDVAKSLSNALAALSDLSIRVQGESEFSKELEKVIEEERLKLIESRRRLIDATDEFKKKFKGEI